MLIGIRCSSVKKNHRFKIFQRPCPWCGQPVSIFKESRFITPVCPACQKPYAETGKIKFCLVFLISTGISAYFTNSLIYPFLFEYFYELIARGISAFMVISFTVILSIKTISIKKC
jgi:endogenous inhibitor of DNA gyrase (YacG/DUF329 family)